MTSPMRFEQDLPALLADLYVGMSPDYRDDLFEQTATHRQRPAWTFLERWLPMSVATRRLPIAPVPWRMIGVLALVIALAAAALLLTAGSQRRHLPPPLGPAANGPLMFSTNGDLFERDGFTGAIRPLLTDPATDDSAGHMPDGQHIVFLRHDGTSAYLMAVAADGTNPVRLLPQSVSDLWMQSSTDSQRLAISATVDGRRILQIVGIDGTNLSTVPLGDLRPLDFQWRPPDDRELLLRAMRPDGSVDLFTIRPDGSDVQALGLHGSGLMGPDADFSGAGWNQSGTRIWYNAVERDPTTGDGQFRIHLVHPDGSGDIRLPAPPDGVNQAWAQSSPDGKTILVQRFRFNPAEVWLALLPADGSGPAREIGRHHFSADGTSLDMGWSPDGRQILLYDGRTDFVSIDPTTGLETKIDWPLDAIPDWRRDGF
jgi:hypothetical protein